MAKKDTKTQSDEAKKDIAHTEGKTIAPPEKVLGEEPDVCPHCPPGKRRLRSKFRNYRFAGAQFFAHVAVVDESKFQQAVKSPFFGQGKDFWEDTAP